MRKAMGALLVWNNFSKYISRYFCVYMFGVLGTLILVHSCDVNTAEKEDYLLKSHKVIEALPRTLSRSDSDMSTALVYDGGKISNDPCSDRKSFEAISMLHRQLDDDASGDIDVSESDEFLRDELQYENGYERHREFHGNDKSISVDELWNVWKVSQVHNWTVEETTEWLLTYVELPEYEHNFRNNGVDGTCLPRMAINSNSLLSSKLGIKDTIHRQKIALKAMDVVLFGPPRHHNYWKDAILALSLLIATGGCWFAYLQHKYSQIHMQKMMRDMEVLQKAEDALQDMQQELNKARQEQEIVNIEKLDLERRLQDEMNTSSKSQSKLYSGSEESRLRELEEQLQIAKNSLQEAEMRLGARAWVAPPTLQHWLQLTYELELKSYNKKKSFAELQLQAAKEGCEKLRKKRSTLVGAFRIAHGGSIDDVDDRIIQARTALSEVTTDLQERTHRWKQIERLCGVPVMQNLGMTYLEAILNPPSMNGSAGNIQSGIVSIGRSSSEGTLVREDSPPPYAKISTAVSNIPPPPKYSKTSPSYNRKVASVIPQKNLRNLSQPVASVKPTHCLESACHNILEAEEEYDQVMDHEEEFMERSHTPVSCSSVGGIPESHRPSFFVGEGIIELGSEAVEPSLGSPHQDFDQQSIQSDQCSSIHSNPSVSQDTHDALKKTNSPDEEKRKRKKTPMSSFVATLKGGFGSSDLIHESPGSSSSGAKSDEKHKKKTFLPQILRKKDKVM